MEIGEKCDKTKQVPELLITRRLGDWAAFSARQAARLGDTLTTRTLESRDQYQRGSFDDVPTNPRLVLERPDRRSHMRQLVSEVPGYPVGTLEMEAGNMSLLLAQLPENNMRLWVVRGYRVFPACQAIMFTYSWHDGIGIQAIVQRPRGIVVGHPLILSKSEVGVVMDRLHPDSRSGHRPMSFYFQTSKTK